MERTCGVNLRAGGVVQHDVTLEGRQQLLVDLDEVNEKRPKYVRHAAERHTNAAKGLTSGVESG